jgi:fatty-acid desaturase
MNKKLLANVRQRTDAISLTSHTDFTARNAAHKTHQGPIMLYTIAVVLLILWLLGLVTSYTVGGFIHILLVVAVIMILVKLISGRGI